MGGPAAVQWDARALIQSSAKEPRLLEEIVHGCTARAVGFSGAHRGRKPVEGEQRGVAQGLFNTAQGAGLQGALGDRDTKLRGSLPHCRTGEGWHSLLGQSDFCKQTHLTLGPLAHQGSSYSPATNHQ